MIKVAITDDHFVVLQGIETMLKDVAGIQIVATNEDANQTMKSLETMQPDVLLLDINLPDENGIDLAQKITSLYPKIKIIALTNYEDISFVKQMIKHGAKGYLLKNTHKEELITAIEAVTNDGEYLQKDIRERIIAESLGKKKQNTFIPKLTKREQEVLQAMADELTTQEISKKLFISPKTVETHRMNLMSKLGAKNSVGIMKIAIQKQLLK